MHIKLPPFVTQPAQPAAIADAASLAQLRIQGSILTATVEASTAKPQLPGQPANLFEVILKTDGQRLLTESAQAFRPGQLLSIQVLPDASIRVLEILQPPLPTSAGIIQQGLREALPLQQNPSILLNNLVQLRAILVQFNQNPAALSAVRQIDQLVQSLPTPAQLQSAAPLKTNVANSGTFLEARLQQQGQGLDLRQASREAPQPSVREALQSNAPLAKALGNTINADFKAQLLSLVATLTPLVPAISASQDPQHSAATALISRIISSLAPAPPTGTPNTRLNPPLQLANLPLDIDLANLLLAPRATQSRDTLAVQEKFDLAMSTVLRQIAATIARVQTNQFTSLASLAGAEANAPQSWHIEIPVYNEGQFRALQLIIEREPDHETGNDEDSRTRQWNITLGFDFQSLGEFYATLRIADNAVSTTFWSERPQTLELIRKELEVLQGSLQQLGLEVKQIDCRKGTPPLKTSRLDQQLVDIET